MCKQQSVQAQELPVRWQFENTPIDTYAPLPGADDDAYLNFGAARIVAIEDAWHARDPSEVPFW